MNKKGFTLVEALIVIAIIGILLLTLIPSIISIINKNKEKACISTRDNIINAAKMYVAENNRSILRSLELLRKTYPPSACHLRKDYNSCSHLVDKH